MPPVTVLIVEDDADIAALIAHFLEKSGFDAEIVPDGGRALTRAKESSPELRSEERRVGKECRSSTVRRIA